jgi:hypothetical protein
VSPKEERRIRSQLLKSGFKVFKVTLPNDKDPDDLEVDMLEGKGEGFKYYLDQAKRVLL